LAHSKRSQTALVIQYTKRLHIEACQPSTGLPAPGLEDPNRVPGLPANDIAGNAPAPQPSGGAGAASFNPAPWRACALASGRPQPGSRPRC
jgi:hypothetical protein